MSTVVRAGSFVLACLSTGMPRPLSRTSALPSGMQGEIDLVAEPGHGFVDRVVHHLPDEVVETLWAGRTDVHRRAFSDSFEPLENGDVLGPVGRGGRQSWLAQRDS